MENEQTRVLFSRDAGDLVQPYSRAEGAWLVPRRGGGGGGGGGRAGGGISSSSGSSSSSSGKTSGSSSSSGKTGTGTATGGSKGFTPGTVSGGSSLYGTRGGRGVSTPYTVTSGAFSGRQAGGGVRSNVYGGGGGYGSGYTSGYTSRGVRAGPVGGLGFPFIFWPVAFGGIGYGGYYGSRELDDDASDRPGGNMTQYTLTPPFADATGNSFALYSDLNSVDAVYQSLMQSCGVQQPLATNFTLNPNQTVAYYRGSSFALMLDGYNNEQPNISSTDNSNTTEVDQALAPLPSTVNQTYLDCLNQTIVAQVPLVEEATSGALALTAFSSPLQFLLLLPAFLVACLLTLL